MANVKIELSVDEEFYLALGIILNNWYALRVGVDGSFRSASEKNKQVEDIFWTSYNSTIAYKRHECSWDDVIGYLESSMAMDLDVLLEDGSSIAILHDILDIYNAILINNREEITHRLKRYKIKRHLLNEEEIDFLKIDVIRKSEDISSGLHVRPSETKERLTLLRNVRKQDVVYSSDGSVSSNHIVADVDTPGNSISIQKNQVTSADESTSMKPSNHYEWTTISRKKVK